MKTVGPLEAQALAAAGADIVDVREPDEWLTGHLPGARLVPLGQLRADPAGALPRDNILFVCARGARSASAALLAEGLGKTQVHSLDGGIVAWAGAGLPTVTPERPRAALAPEASDEAPPAAVDEPALDALVGVNLQRYRAAQGLSLDDLAREAGVSRSILGQIELGRAVPSISIVWKLAQTLGIPFSAMLSTAPSAGTSVSRRAQARRLLSADGRFSSRALFPLGNPRAAEFYEIWLAPHSREDADPHRPGTQENLVVTAGQLELRIGRDVRLLGPGDVVVFAADVPHSYVNPGKDECWMYLVVNYLAGLAPGRAWAPSPARPGGTLAAMFELTHRDGVFPLIDLIDRDADSLATVAPARGGLVTRFRAQGTEVLYLDEASFLDPTKNVRGGNPVLFPSPGKLSADRWARGGHQGALKQHGFARNLAWSVVREETAEAASVTLAIESSAATRADFPFDFEASYTYALRGNALHIAMHFGNKGAEAMPFGAGFHPYFAVPQAQKAQAAVATAATRAFDNVTKTQVPYRLDLAAGEVDLHLLDHGGSSSSLSWPAGRVTLEGSPAFSHWVIWSLPGKDFVCLEPWTCPGDALNTGDRLLLLPPGGALDLSLSLRFERA